MKKTLVLISLALSTLAAAQKDKTYKCHLHEEGIDDLSSPTAELEFSEKGKFTYLISNDNENLYIDLRIADKNVQRQVMMDGITIWINTDGKKQKKTGIKYPVVMAHRGGGGMPPQAGGNGSSSVMADSLKLIGLSEEEEKTIFAGEKGNFRGSIKMQNNQALLYKLVLPLEKLKAISSDEKNKELSYMLGISYSEPPEGGRAVTTVTGTKVVGVPSSSSEIPSGGRGGGGRQGSASMSSGSGMPSGGRSYSTVSQILIWLEPLALASRN